MQEDRVDRVHGVLGNLQPVAGIIPGIGHHLNAGDAEGVIDGEHRPAVGRAQIGEDQPLDLLDRIGTLAQARPKPFGRRAVRRLARRLQDRSVHVVQPAVVAAAQAPRFADAIFQRGAAVRAVAVQQADGPAALAEQDQVLAQHADQFRQVADLGGEGDRMPEAAQVFAAGRPGRHMGHLDVLAPGACVQIAAVGGIGRIRPRVHGVTSTLSANAAPQIRNIGL